MKRSAAPLPGGYTRRRPKREPSRVPAIVRLRARWGQAAVYVKGQRVA